MAQVFLASGTMPYLSAPIDVGRPQFQEMDRTPIITNEVAYIVHNTFVDYPATRPPSLEEFFHPRLSKSVPGSGIEEIPYEMDMIGLNTKQTKSPPAPEPAPVLHLADVLHPELEVGFSDFPSVGSQGHHQGTCKPCAFFWTEEGCKNGSACSFCHLCEQGAKKKRQREKKKVRAMAKFQRALFRRNAPS